MCALQLIWLKAGGFSWDSSKLDLRSGPSGVFRDNTSASYLSPSMAFPRHLKHALLWVLMPLGTVVLSVLAALLAAGWIWLMAKWEGGWADDGWMLMYGRPIVASVMFGFTWAMVPTWLAPSAKRWAALVMSGLLAMIMIGATILVWSVDIELLHPPVVETLMHLGCILGMAIGLNAPDSIIASSA
jgi:hypothetical protein